MNMQDTKTSFRYTVCSSDKTFSKKIGKYLALCRAKASLIEIGNLRALELPTDHDNTILIDDESSFFNEKTAWERLLNDLKEQQNPVIFFSNFKSQLSKHLICQNEFFKVLSRKLSMEEFEFQLSVLEAQHQDANSTELTELGRFRLLADLPSEGILLHQNMLTKDWNRRVMDLFGYNGNELIGKNILEFMADQESKKKLKKEVGSQSENPFEVLGITKSGETFHLELRSRRANNGSGELKAIIFRDITKRKHKEQEIRKLNTAIDQSQSSIVITDTEGKIEYVNQSFCDISGYSLGEVMGRNPRMLKSKYHAAPYYKNLWRTITSGNTWYGTFKNKSKQGTHYWEKAVISPILDDKQNISHFLAIKENITGEMAALDALKASEERHRIISKLTNDFVYSATIFDNALNIDWSSGSLAKLSGYSVKEMADFKFGWYTIVDQVDLENILKPAISQLSMQRVLTLEYRIVSKSGAQKWVLDKIQLLSESRSGSAFQVVGALKDITESKEANLALDQSKKYLDTIIDNLPVGLQIFDGDGNRERINTMQEKIFSTNRLSLNKGTYNILKNQSSVARGVAKQYREVYENKKTVNHNIEIKIKGEDNSSGSGKVFIEEIIFPMLHNDGSIRSVISLSSDITSKVKAENALIASERYQKVLLKIIPDLIFVFTKQGVFKNVYTEEENLILPVNKFLGKSFSEVFPGELSDKFYKYLKRAIRTKELQSYNYQIEVNGILFSYETRLLLSKDNEVVAIIRDITDSVNAERALKDSEERFRELAERIQDALVLISASNEILYVSPNLFDILGISQDEYLQNPLNALKLIHKNDKHWVIPELNNYRKGKSKALDLQFRVVLQSGVLKWIWYRESTVFDKKGNPQRYASVITDITENKAVEEELKIAKEEAEKANRSKSAFLANISHEIRTPMNAVLGFSDLLYSRIKDPVLKGYLNSIKSSGNTLLNLLNDILDLSKIEAQKMTIIPSPINLFDILREIKHIFSLKALEKGLDYKFEVDKNLPKSLVLDELRIKQILLNLVDNAIKFTDKGHIRILVRHFENYKRRNYVDLLIEVEDTGIGVPYHLQESIFDSFRQQDDQDKKKFQGTGLGLAITKRLVELFEGDINLESHPDKGSRFEVLLKKVKISKSSEKSETYPKRKLQFETPALRGKVIVLIDREKSNRELVKEVFYHSKSKVIQGENIETLLSLTRKKIDLLILEIGNADALHNDLSAIRSVKKFNDIPKIGISSMGSIDKHYANDFIAILTKPIHLPDLVEIVSNYFQIDEINRTDRIITERTIDHVDRNVALAVIELLEQKHYPEWEDALTTSSFSEIENFANSMKKLGVEYNFKSLETFSDVLVMHAKNFDIDNMNDVLKSFPSLISELRNTL